MEAALTFERSWWLLAWLALPYLWRLRARRRPETRWREVVDDHLLDALLTEAGGTRRRVDPWSLFLAAFALAVLALAEPLVGGVAIGPSLILALVVGGALAFRRGWLAPR